VRILRFTRLLWQLGGPAKRPRAISRYSAQQAHKEPRVVRDPGFFFALCTIQKKIHRRGAEDAERRTSRKIVFLCVLCVSAVSSLI